MNTEQLLAILYEMALISGDHTRVQPLVITMLQKLMYHTSFPCGLFFSDIRATGNGGEHAEGLLEAAIGGAWLRAAVGTRLPMPGELLIGPPGMIENGPLLRRTFTHPHSYAVALRLPLPHNAAFLLLSPAMPPAPLPLMEIFQPVLNNFAKLLEMARINEAYTGSLREERAEAVTALRRFRAALDHSADAIFLVDGATRQYIDCNATAEWMTGYARDEFAGMGPCTLHPGMGEEQCDRIFRQLLEGQEEGAELVTTLRRKDGKELPVEMRLNAFKPAEGTPVIIAIARDIAERLAAESERQRFMAAMDQAAETIIITDPEGTIQYANPAFEQAAGHPVKDVIGKKLSTLPYNGEPPEYYQRIFGQLADGVVWNGLSSMARANGATLVQSNSASPVYGPGFRLLNFVFVRRDVTSEAMLQRAREQFTVITSHELRTPLAKLYLVRQMLENYRTQHPGDRDLGTMTESMRGAVGDLDRLLAATTYLVELSMHDRPQFLSPVAPALTIVSAVERAREHARQSRRGVAVELDISDACTAVTFPGRKEMIDFAMDNILSNAIKYTQDGRAVRVGCQKEERAVTLTVADEGIGIPPETVDTLFQPYFSPTTMDVNKYHSGRYIYRGGGLGLGLVVTRMIVEYHGGSLGIQSPGKNRGTVVTLRFPVG